MYAVIVRRTAALAALCLLAAGCGAEGVTAEEGDGRLRGAPALSGDQNADRAELERLENAAKALVRADGCAEVGACAVAPVGAKACGGPRYYITYCRTSTDVPALQARLAELESFERDFNRRYGIASTCDVAPQLTPELSGGSCRGVAPR